MSGTDTEWDILLAVIAPLLWIQAIGSLDRREGRFLSKAELSRHLTAKTRNDLQLPMYEDFFNSLGVEPSR